MTWPDADPPGRLVELAIAELPCPIEQAPRTALEAAAHAVAPESHADYQTVLMALEVRQLKVGASPNGSGPALAEGDPRVAEELERLRVRDTARRIYNAELAPPRPKPELLTLRQRIARGVPQVSWRIEGWQPAGSRVVLAAQRKAGKTTLVGNLARSLVDGDPWLDSAQVKPTEGRVVILDFEMGTVQLDRWLADQSIANDDRIVPIPLRGRGADFDLFSPECRTEWAERLQGLEATYLILDCLGPVLNALSLSEDREAGRFLTQLDALLIEAGVPDTVVVHHMGHVAERSRGDSRLRDWPEVEWRLVRAEGENDASPRFLSAYGRDVDVAESQLGYDAATRRLTLIGGSRSGAAARAALADVVTRLDDVGEASTNEVEQTLLAETSHRRAAIRAALKIGTAEGVLTETPGKHNAHLYSVSSPVRRSSPQPRQRTTEDLASSPIGGEVSGDDREDRTSPRLKASEAPDPIQPSPEAKETAI